MGLEPRDSGQQCTPPPSNVFSPLVTVVREVANTNKNAHSFRFWLSFRGAELFQATIVKAVKARIEEEKKSMDQLKRQ